MRTMSRRRKATNLTLSEDALTKAEALRAADTRPSISNLIEALVVREHQRVMGQPKPAAQPEKAEVAA